MLSLSLVALVHTPSLAWPDAATASSTAVALTGAPPPAPTPTSSEVLARKFEAALRQRGITREGVKAMGVLADDAVRSGLPQSEIGHLVRQAVRRVGGAAGERVFVNLLARLGGQLAARLGGYVVPGLNVLQTANDLRELLTVPSAGGDRQNQTERDIALQSRLHEALQGQGGATGILQVIDSPGGGMALEILTRSALRPEYEASRRALLHGMPALGQLAAQGHAAAQSVLQRLAGGPNAALRDAARVQLRGLTTRRNPPEVQSPPHPAGLISGRAVPQSIPSPSRRLENVAPVGFSAVQQHIYSEAAQAEQARLHPSLQAYQAGLEDLRLRASALIQAGVERPGVRAAYTQLVQDFGAVAGRSQRLAMLQGAQALFSASPSLQRITDPSTAETFVRASLAQRLDLVGKQLVGAAEHFVARFTQLQHRLEQAHLALSVGAGDVPTRPSQLTVKPAGDGLLSARPSPKPPQHGLPPEPPKAPGIPLSASNPDPDPASGQRPPTPGSVVVRPRPTLGGAAAAEEHHRRFEESRVEAERILKTLIPPPLSNQSREDLLNAAIQTASPAIAFWLATLGRAIGIGPSSPTALRADASVSSADVNGVLAAIRQASSQQGVLELIAQLDPNLARQTAVRDALVERLGALRTPQSGSTADPTSASDRRMPNPQRSTPDAQRIAHWNAHSDDPEVQRQVAAALSSATDLRQVTELIRQLDGRLLAHPHLAQAAVRALKARQEELSIAIGFVKARLGPQPLPGLPPDFLPAPQIVRFVKDEIAKIGSAGRTPAEQLDQARKLLRELLASAYSYPLDPKISNELAFARLALGTRVAVLDVQGLKWVNDVTHSHAIGDKFLQWVALTLDRVVEAMGVKNVKIFQIGGSRFALSGSEPDVLREISRRMVSELNGTRVSLRTPGMTFQVPSIKVVTQLLETDQHDSRSALLSAIDRAVMQEAQRRQQPGGDLSGRGLAPVDALFSPNDTADVGVSFASGTSSDSQSMPPQRNRRDPTLLLRTDIEAQLQGLTFANMEERLLHAANMAYGQRPEVNGGLLNAKGKEKFGWTGGHSVRGDLEAVRLANSISWMAGDTLLQTGFMNWRRAQFETDARFPPSRPSRASFADAPGGDEVEVTFETKKAARYFAERIAQLNNATRIQGLTGGMHVQIVRIRVYVGANSNPERADAKVEEAKLRAEKDGSRIPSVLPPYIRLTRP